MVIKVKCRLVHIAVRAEYNILSNKQYGFRGNYSTYMAMIVLIDKISSNTDHKNHNIGIFLDLSNAFDTIDRNI